MHRPRPIAACAWLVFVATAGAGSAALAQPIKPGLWEIRSTVQQGAGGKAQTDAMAQMRAQMAQLPPAQRKQMEAMLAQQGMSVDDSGLRMKTCLTPDMVARFEAPPPQQGDCKTTMAPRSGNTQRFTFQCSQPPSRGDGVVTFTSPEAYSVRTQVTAGTGAQTQATTMDASGRWLGADCGSVKPLTVPPAAK